MLIIIGALTMRPELVEEVKPILAGVRAETLKEEGCIGYDGHVSLDNPAKLVFIERWVTEEAFRKHLQTPHVSRWREISSRYVINRDVEIVHVGRIESLAPAPAVPPKS